MKDNPPTSPTQLLRRLDPVSTPTENAQSRSLCGSPRSMDSNHFVVWRGWQFWYNVEIKIVSHFQNAPLIFLLFSYHVFIMTFDNEMKPNYYVCKVIWLWCTTDRGRGAYLRACTSSQSVVVFNVHTMSFPHMWVFPSSSSTWLRFGGWVGGGAKAMNGKSNLHPPPWQYGHYIWEWVAQHVHNRAMTSSSTNLLPHLCKLLQTS